MVGSVSATPATATAGAPSVQWKTCDRPVQEGVECGSITVPVDWSHPAKALMPVQVYRLKATDRASVKGTIANFPSGPGTTADIAFAGLREAAPEYDLVGVDPRGVGGSSPLTCDPRGVDLPPLVPPTTKAGLNELSIDQQRFRAACTVTPAMAADHLDATSAAQDVEYLRRALRLPRINLYGHSYGTLLAEKYLAHFGRSARASILEGMIDPTLSRREFVTTAAAASETLFAAFTRWCASTTTCALQGQDPVEALRRAQINADTGVIPGDFYGRPWQAAAVTYLFEIEVSGNRMASFARQLLQLAQGENPVPSTGAPGDTAEVTERFPYTDPIVCQDFPLAIRGADDAADDLAATRRVAPTVGYNVNAHQYTAACVGWPGPVRGSGTPVTSRSTHPTLLVGNTGDIATPVAWAESVKRQLGGKAALLTVDQNGHSASIDTPGCAQRIIRDYLDTLRAPRGRHDARHPRRTATEHPLSHRPAARQPRQAGTSGEATACQGEAEPQSAHDRKEQRFGMAKDKAFLGSGRGRTHRSAGSRR
ncbi:alpha/beta hydrolase [Saccharothrix isguenensis]